MHLIPELKLYIEKYTKPYIYEASRSERTYGQKIKGSLPVLAMERRLLPRFHGKARERYLIFDI